MASSTAGGHYCLLLALLLLSSASFGQSLSENFYAKNCSSLNTIIEREVNATLFTPPPLGDRRMGASLLRLFFHDSFVQGCDASVLLDVYVDSITGKNSSEKDAGPNKSLRGFEVIDSIKSKVEAACPGVVSCADILALVTRAAVVQLGGPSWTLRLGRRDSMTANKTEAETDLPSPFSDLGTLIKAFNKKGFNASELVALSGAHTIGLAQCQFADPDRRDKQLCLGGVGTASLDKQTPKDFDNRYYGNLLKHDGLLHSDQVLTSLSDVNATVQSYRSNQNLFFGAFASAMNRMSELHVLTGTNGQVRTNCSKVN